MIKTTLLACLALASTSLAAQQLRHSSPLELDGIGQHLSVPSHEDFDILADDSYTISLWFNANRTYFWGPTQRVVARRLNSRSDSLDRSGYDVMALRNTAANFFGATLTDLKGSAKQAFDGWAPAAQKSEMRQWYHIALVIDRASSLVRLYVDGTETRSAQISSSEPWQTSNGLPLLIGCGNEQGKPFAHFGGLLDNVRFYKRALSPSEVRQDRQSERIKPNTKGLVAAFDFDGYKIGDTEIRDATGRHTARLVGFDRALEHPRVKSFAARRTNGSLIGRGTNQALGLCTVGLREADRLTEAIVGLEGTTRLADLRSLKLYASSNGDRFDHRSPGVLIAQGRVADSTVVLRPIGRASRLSGLSKLWLVADVADDAHEGNAVKAEIKSLHWRKGPQFVPSKRADLGTQTIVLGRTLLWTPGENRSAHYRIPALVRMQDGSLVAAIDKRKNSDYDLPEDIDVEVKISQDNGKTWSAPITVAQGTPEHGYGDAAIATDGKTIHMVMVAGSGLWYYPSAAKKPLEMYYSQSTDGGRSWTPVRDITAMVQTDRFPNGGFFGSGNGIITSRGRIAFVAAMRVDAKWGGQMDNVMVYSDDAGATWHASPVARYNGDEAKIVELANGDLLISSRNRASGATPRTYVTSSDHGQTWSGPRVWHDLKGNACNAALTRYSLEDGKGGRNILLHTLLEAGDRRNLRLYMSEDEGKTWPYARTLCLGEAAYSEIAILSDGTIGIISEEDDRPAYDIYFTRLSLDWLRSGRRE